MVDKQWGLIFFLLACVISVPWPGVKPMPLVMEVQSPRHWTSRKFPGDEWRFKHKRPFLSSRILQRRRPASKWVLYLFVMSVKTGVLGSCGSSHEGYQILTGAEGIFLGKLMTELSLEDQVRGKKHFIRMGHWRLRDDLEACGWDVRLEDRGMIIYKRPCVLPE